MSPTEKQELSAILNQLIVLQNRMKDDGASAFHYSAELWNINNEFTAAIDKKPRPQPVNYKRIRHD